MTRSGWVVRSDWVTRSGWVGPGLLMLVAIVGLRLVPGYLFGGSGDQRGYVGLWYSTEARYNPYSEGPHVMAWPPLWWLIIGVLAEAWRLAGVDAWVGNVDAARSFAIKVCYFLAEIGGALLLGAAVARERLTGDAKSCRSQYIIAVAAAFLLLPCTWIITALHGNFDVIPALLTFAAFWLMYARADRDAAFVSSLLLGFGMMARTIPGMFVLPLAAEIFRRHGPRWGIWCVLWFAMPTILSMLPLFLLAPEEVMERVFAYRGNLDGWWGLGAMVRLLWTDAAAQEVSGWNLSLSYPLFLALSCMCVALLWHRRITVLTAGMLMVTGLLALAPTISNQNFYFLLPWAFWSVVTGQHSAARAFLWVLSINLLLVYIVLPTDLYEPVWFHWTYSFPEASRLRPIPSPVWLTDLLKAMAVFGREGMDFNTFLQIVLRLPAWVVLWVWLVGQLRLALASPRPEHSS